MVSEIALATLLVTGALSMARYFTQLMHTDPGINPDHVLSMNVSLSPARYAKAASSNGNSSSNSWIV